MNRQFTGLKRTRARLAALVNERNPPQPPFVEEARVDGTAAAALGRAAMADTEKPLPDRLSLDPRSPFFDEDVLERGVGIRFNGQEKTNVEEYCVSEGWIKVAAGRSRDRYGNPMTLTLKGTVEPYFEQPKSSEE